MKRFPWYLFEVSQSSIPDTLVCALQDIVSLQSSQQGSRDDFDCANLAWTDGQAHSALD